MSAFLGKIHYWLYDKILLQEALIDSIASLAHTNGFDSEALLNESYTRFGFPVKGQLESEIDHSNIHGWLQQRISSVESRMAFVVTELLKNNAVQREDIEELFFKQAVDAMRRLELHEPTPETLFQLLFDHVLEGMPCDRVNEVIASNEHMISWATTSDLHENFWTAVGGDPQNHHRFRDAWIHGFLSASRTDFKYVKADNNISTIGRI